MELKDCMFCDEPDPALYSKRCKFCWPQLLRNEGEGEADSSNSDTGLSGASD